MKAKIMTPNYDCFLQDADWYRQIALMGNSLSAVVALDDNRYKVQDEIDLPSPADGVDCTQQEFEAFQLNFLEEAFAYTALHPKWDHKRSISVGDILEIEGGRTWFCASVGWACVK